MKTAAETITVRGFFDRNTYMNVDIKDLEKTVFHGQTVDKYKVFGGLLPR